MMFGLPDTTLQAIRKTLASCSGLEKSVIYGSRAMGTHRPGSDIDLVLVGDVSDAELNRLLIALDDLNTPYLFDVVREQDIDNDALRQHIEQVGKRFDK
ncbi:nucleotidyltransferase domain-containing protein [Vreelandella aquamarina]|uniref:nucleotidyltransferase domain-containing protein n=1 Tax=Vreelandella aquamarina TaxID=77097 RepID=UPI003850A7C6